jgi:hypothetical protein
MCVLENVELVLIEYTRETISILIDKNNNVSTSRKMSFFCILQ